MSEGAAHRWADEWFTRFAGDENVDENGFYLYLDWTAGDPSLQASIVAYAGSHNGSTHTGYEHLRPLTEDELGEYLMYFSDFHLNLLSFSSPIVFERIRAALGDSPKIAARKREQMQQIVQAIATRD
jgi:hypothetical protein